MRISSYILLINILLIPAQVMAQENVGKENKRYDMFSFNGIGIQADLSGFAGSLLQDYSSSEFAVELNFGNRFYPIVEAGLGWSDTTDETTGIKYKAKAPYYRVGFNYNFFTSKEKPAPQHYIFGLIRYAWTDFEYDIDSPPITDPIWGNDVPLVLNDVEGSCSWAEIGAGIKVKIAKGFHMGWSIRYRVRIMQEQGNNSSMWYIPGYGINKSTCFGGTYNLIYEIPFKKGKGER